MRYNNKKIKTKTLLETFYLPDFDDDDDDFTGSLFVEELIKDLDKALQELFKQEELFKRQFIGSHDEPYRKVIDLIDETKDQFFNLKTKLISDKYDPNFVATVSKQLSKNQDAVKKAIAEYVQQYKQFNRNNTLSNDIIEKETDTVIERGKHFYNQWNSLHQAYQDIKEDYPGIHKIYNGLKSIYPSLKIDQITKDNIQFKTSIHFTDYIDFTNFIDENKLAQVEKLDYADNRRLEIDARGKYIPLGDCLNYNKAVRQVTKDITAELHKCSDIPSFEQAITPGGAYFKWQIDNDPHFVYVAFPEVIDFDESEKKDLYLETAEDYFNIMNNQYFILRNNKLETKGDIWADMFIDIDLLPAAEREDKNSKLFDIYAEADDWEELDDE